MVDSKEPNPSAGTSVAGSRFQPEGGGDELRPNNNLVNQGGEDLKSGKAGELEAKIATDGILNPDEARASLEALSGETRGRIILSVMGEVVQLECQKILFLSRQDLIRLIQQRKLKPVDAQKVLERLESRLKTVSERKGIESLANLSSELKNSSDPQTQALGYDLEIAEINKQLALGISKEERKELTDEEKRLLQERKAKLQEERDKLRIKDKDGKEAEIPNQLEILTQQVVRAVKKANGEASELTEEQTKTIKEDPLSILISAFSQGLEAAIDLEEKKVKEGTEIVINPNPEKFNQFLTALVTEGAISENDKESMADYFKDFADEIKGNLTEEEKKIIFQNKLDRLKSLTPKVGLGLGAILLILIYMAYKSEMGASSLRG